MPVYRLNVKWRKEKFNNVECNTDDTTENFKAVLFSLTGVPPERQKVMMPGGILNSTFEGFRLKDGLTIMLMGTSDELLQSGPVDIPTESIQIANENVLKLPHGMLNLGNTCYMNATIQLLHAVPELRAALKAFTQPTFGGASSALVASLRVLFESIDGAKQSVIPAVFVTCLRNFCPQFATRIPGDTEEDSQTAGLLAIVGGRFAQQDANECWVELMNAMQQVSINPRTMNLPDIIKQPQFSIPWNPVERYFTGRLSISLICTETDEEPSISDETFSQISCFINQDVKFLHTGIRNGFEGTVVKHSTSLGRDAVYKKNSTITRLPAYLSIHFIRFFYKEDKRLSAKILKDIKFPLELDLFTFCSDALQKKLTPMREKMRIQDDLAVHDKSRLEKTKSVHKPEAYETYSLPDDPGSNNSGYYELMGVVSHQGRTSSSGHYVAWVKVDGNWIKFDDDVVTVVTPEDILRLSGGGDWHCAYILLYGPKLLLKVSSDSEIASNDAAVSNNLMTKVEGDRRVN